MSITVFEALQLPIMKRASLVAGHEGVNAPIKWVTIVEVIEDTTRLQEGEFLITTAYGLAEDYQRQNVFIEELAKQKISALAIQTGFYLHTIPRQFIEAANHYRLPLFELPADINFSMVTKEVLQQVVNRQFEQMSYSEDIHRKLIELVLANGGLPAIAHLLASWTSGDVLIMNQHAQLLAESSSILTKGQMEHLLSRFKHQEAREFMFRDYFIFVTPVVADQTKLGDLLVLKKNNSLAELDKLAIGQAAIVCALEFLKLAAVEQAEQRLQEDLLEEVIQNKFTSKHALIEKAKAFSLDLSAPHTVVKISFGHLENEQMKQQLINSLTDILQLERCKFLVKHRHESLLMLIETESSSTRINKFLFEKINASWEKLAPGLSVQIGVGKSYSDISLLADSAKQADQAIKYASLLFQHQSITYYEDLAPYSLFINLIEQGMSLSTYYQPVLDSLLGYDAKHNSELLYTLEMFLYHNMNIQKASAELFIHRHTLKYRLDKIADLTGMDVLDYHQRLQLHTALICYKLDCLKQQESI